MLELCIALSAHINLGTGWNDQHACIRYETSSFSVGAFWNSENAVSTYAAMKIGDNPGRNDIYAEVGIATGYSWATIQPYGRILVELSDNLSLYVIPMDWDSRGFVGVVGTELTVARW